MIDFTLGIVARVEIFPPTGSQMTHAQSFFSSASLCRRSVNRKTIAFWGTTRSPAFTMHKFTSENLRVNIWRDNFTSDYLRVNLPSSNLSKLSKVSEPSIVKFIENQSEHLSKLTLYHLKKRATKRCRRAREPSRIPLAFLRGLNRTQQECIAC